INPQLQNVVVSVPVELRWTNSYGIETNGYLIRPFGYQSGRRYPLLVITYGFGGGYVTDAEGLSSYPAQVFARDGFVVLMANFPRYDDWSGRSFARGSVAWGYSPLASVEA